MGGVRGEVRGQNKGECVDRFQELLQEELEGWSVWPSTRSRRELKKLMEQDSEPGEWVLRYYAHT